MYQNLNINSVLHFSSSIQTLTVGSVVSTDHSCCCIPGTGIDAVHCVYTCTRETLATGSRTLPPVGDCTLP